MSLYINRADCHKITTVSVKQKTVQKEGNQSLVNVTESCRFAIYYHYNHHLMARHTITCQATYENQISTKLQIKVKYFINLLQYSMYMAKRGFQLIALGPSSTQMSPNFSLISRSRLKGHIVTGLCS